MSDEIYCPSCKMEVLYNPCDPGCCTAFACKKCRKVWGLKQMEGAAAEHYLDCIDPIGSQE